MAATVRADERTLVEAHVGLKSQILRLACFSVGADSAAAIYQQVVKTYPSSPRAPSALYKLGLLAEQRGDKAAARTYYARVISGYARSEEANLARDKLQRLGR